MIEKDQANGGYQNIQFLAQSCGQGSNTYPGQ